MPIDERKYKRLKDILATRDDVSDEARAKAEAAIAEYDNAFMGKAAQVEMPMAFDQDKAQRVLKQLDPTQPLQPQVLSVQPATAHPAGDKVAQDEWVRGDLDNAAGKVIVYEAPVAKVREDLMRNPQIFKALGYDAPLSPDAVTAIQDGDSVHQAYNDWKWGQTADAAVKAGKTPYRYAKAPWLKSGTGAGVLDTLSTKLGAAGRPAVEGATAFVLGFDNTAAFGAATSAAEAGLLDPSEEEKKELQAEDAALRSAFGGGDSKDEVSGGVTEEAKNRPTSEFTDMVREDNAGAHAAGQVLGIAPGLVAGAVKTAGKGLAKAAGVAGEAAEGAVKAGAEAVEGGVKQLADWVPSTKLWEWVIGQNPGLLRSTVGGGLAAGLHQGVTEGVRAAANYAGTGDTGTTLKDAALRSGRAYAGGLALSALPAGVQGASRGYNKWVETGRRYEAIPGRLRQLGTEFKLLKGPVPSPAVKAAREEAASRAGVGGVKPIDVVAEKMEQPITQAAKGNVQAAKIGAKSVADTVHASAEGKARLPATNIVTTTLDIMRTRMDKLGKTGRLTSAGVPNAEGPTKRIFNQNIEGVSLRPVEGAIPVKLEEARAFLSPFWQRNTLKASSAPDKAFRRKTADALAVRAPEAGGRASGEGIERAAEGALANTPKGLARTPRYGGARHPELEAKDLAKAAPDAAVRGSRAATAGERSGAELPKVTARNLGPEGARWRRRGPKEQAAAAQRASERDAVAGDFVQQLRSRGVKTVYVLPRRYNSKHHESVVQMLRKRRDESATDRDLVKVYNAALKDRDPRTFQGVPGAWSALQRQNERSIGAAKDIQRRVAPDTPKGAHGRVVSLAKQKEGQSKDLKAMELMADRAGVTEQLGAARSLDILEDLENRISLGRVRRGDVRSPLSPSGWFDSANIRVGYPIAKGIEKSGIGKGREGKLATLGDDPEASPEKRRRARDEARRADYEKATKPEPKKKRARKKKRRKKS